MGVRLPEIRELQEGAFADMRPAREVYLCVDFRDEARSRLPLASFQGLERTSYQLSLRGYGLDRIPDDLFAELQAGELSIHGAQSLRPEQITAIENSGKIHDVWLGQYENEITDLNEAKIRELAKGLRSFDCHESSAGDGLRCFRRHAADGPKASPL
jgi:hypothetical protein